MRDTIAAIATAISPYQGSVAILRLSGGEAMNITKGIFVSASKQSWESHKVRYGWIRDSNSQEILDEVLVLPMLAPKSYTCEDVVEIHCHGGTICVNRILDLCLRKGARLAEPGEFTLRAFLNGRLELSQAEAIAELVSARSEEAANRLVGNLKGNLTTKIRALRNTCVHLLAEIEAEMDFEEDTGKYNFFLEESNKILKEVDSLLVQNEQDRLIEKGVKVAIIGKPNVGKSTLLNQLSHEEKAIVTETPGTTRDILQSEVLIEGILCTFFDTAGIRETENTVENIGVSRANKVAMDADIVLLLIDSVDGWSEEESLIVRTVLSV